MRPICLLLLLPLALACDPKTSGSTDGAVAGSSDGSTEAYTGPIASDSSGQADDSLDKERFVAELQSAVYQAAYERCRDREIADLEADLTKASKARTRGGQAQRLRDDIDGLRTGRLMPIVTMDGGAFGVFKSSQQATFRVIQVLADGVLARRTVDRKTYLIGGIDVSSLTTDDMIDLTDRLIYVHGPRTYETAIGGTNTVLEFAVVVETDIRRNAPLRLGR